MFYDNKGKKEQNADSALLSGLTRILMRMKGLEEEAAVFDLAAHKQREYDRLADLIRSSLDMQQIYNILDKGIQG